MKPPSMNANNQDLFVWSLFLLNGGSEWVDVEDIYLKSFELAPERLSWRTRRDIPDYKKCAKALQSVEAPGKNHEGMLVKKSEHERKLSTKDSSGATPTPNSSKASTKARESKLKQHMKQPAEYAKY